VQNFVASLSAVNMCSISGTVTGPAVDGVTISLSECVMSAPTPDCGTATASTTTDGSGNYQITGLPYGMYMLTAFKNGYTFSPEWHWFTILGADVTEMNFTISAEGTDGGSSSTTVATDCTSSPTSVCDQFCRSGYDCPSGVCGPAGVCL
jgi:hypothetical protein